MRASHPPPTQRRMRRELFIPSSLEQRFTTHPHQVSRVDEVSLPNQTDDLTGMPHCNCGQHGLRIIRSCCANGGCWSGFRVPETAAAGAETPQSLAGSMKSLVSPIVCCCFDSVPQSFRIICGAGGWASVSLLRLARCEQQWGVTTIIWRLSLVAPPPT